MWPSQPVKTSPRELTAVMARFRIGPALEHDLTVQRPSRSHSSAGTRHPPMGGFRRLEPRYAVEQLTWVHLRANGRGSATTNANVISSKCVLRLPECIGKSGKDCCARMASKLRQASVARLPSTARARASAPKTSAGHRRKCAANCRLLSWSVASVKIDRTRD